MFQTFSDFFPEKKFLFICPLQNMGHAVEIIMISG